MVGARRFAARDVDHAADGECRIIDIVVIPDISRVAAEVFGDGFERIAGLYGIRDLIYRHDDELLSRLDDRLRRQVVGPEDGAFGDAIMSGDTREAIAGLDHIDADDAVFGLLKIGDRA